MIVQPKLKTDVLDGLTALAVILVTFPIHAATKTVITDKTLIAWATPANLTQRGGSVLTIEKSRGVFDAIVFGELATARWMAGSNGFARTKKRQGDFPAETADAKTLVQIAMVYK